MEYSVIIRTLGTAGEKYAALLRSVEAQTLPAKEVVVVLAEGYAEPPYHTANERIVRTRKGMLHQRQVGFEQANTPFLLVMDDDIVLEPDFAEKTLSVMQSTGADAAFTGGATGVRKLLYYKELICGERFLSRKQSPFYLRIWGTGGTIYNSCMHPDERYYCQTANFQCFMMRREVALDTHLDEEMWLEDTGYAWPDDRVFFYKAYLKGYRTVYVPETTYHNLDARTGHAPDAEKTWRDYYTHQRNISIFWHKYLYNSTFTPPIRNSSHDYSSPTPARCRRCFLW